MESFAYRAARRALARTLRSTKTFDRKLRGPPRANKGGAALSPWLPLGRPRCGSQRKSSSCRRLSFMITRPSDSPALRLPVLGIFRDVPQDELRKLHNQILETRYFLPAPRQLAFFFRHYRHFKAVPSRTTHVGPQFEQVITGDGSSTSPASIVLESRIFTPIYMVRYGRTISLPRLVCHLGHRSERPVQRLGRHGAQRDRVLSFFESGPCASGSRLRLRKRIALVGCRPRRYGKCQPSRSRLSAPEK
ncbi:hypothetical protein CI41S_21820 [Bradyrhizobium ivorense]|nr:hypothetical protein CI41S_21820 [Bradyrhizobium ivorense]